MNEAITPRLYLVGSLLAARVSSGHVTSEIDDSEIAKIVQVADRTLAAMEPVEESAPVPEPYEEPTEPAPPYVIDGLSASQTAALLEAFPTAEALDAATDDELITVKGIGTATIAAIRAARAPKTEVSDDGA